MKTKTIEIRRNYTFNDLWIIGDYTACGILNEIERAGKKNTFMDLLLASDLCMEYALKNYTELFLS